MPPAKFMTFGELFKFLRKQERISLRDIAQKLNSDPSNLSKIERDLMAPPKDKDLLSYWAKILKLKKTSPYYHQFFDLAAIARGDIPKDILNNDELLPLLPAFFRTIRGKKPTQEQIEQLIEMIRKS